MRHGVSICFQVIKVHNGVQIAAFKIHLICKVCHCKDQYFNWEQMVVETVQSTLSSQIYLSVHTVEFVNKWVARSTNYFPKILNIFFAYMLCNVSVRMLKYFQKLLKSCFARKKWKNYPKKLHNYSHTHYTLKRELLVGTLEAPHGVRQVNGVPQSGADWSATAESRVRANWSNRFTVLKAVGRFFSLMSQLPKTAQNFISIL